MAVFQRAHTDEITFVDISSDGQLAMTASADGVVRVWNRQTRTRVGEPLVHTTRVNCARFSPDGLRAVTSTVNRLLRVWDVQSGAPLTDWLSSVSTLPGVWFTGDGSSVITGDGYACPIHAVQGSAPDWLPRLAEAVGGLRYNQSQTEERMPASAFLELRAALATTPAEELVATRMKQFLGPTRADVPKMQPPDLK